MKRTYFDQRFRERRSKEQCSFCWNGAGTAFIFSAGNEERDRRSFVGTGTNWELHIPDFGKGTGTGTSSNFGLRNGNENAVPFFEERLNL